MDQLSNEEIDISEQIENFKDHIDIDGNLRIVVSGAFGSGKTYFLNKFFKENEVFDVIKIYPVNYSVARNEDIFKLIKFDILFELLNNQHVSYDKEYFDKLLTSQLFIQQNAFDILKPLIEIIPKIGKAVIKVSDTLIPFSEKFEKFHKSVQIDGEKTAINHIKKIKDAIFSIEEDSITQLIRNSIQSLSDKNIITVLLIDDLDRIDPEHIFRILNVFSSHFTEDENKFFFDKVILVCDIENIRGIFHTRYGSQIDFSGYIDKFYSRNIFRFDNNENVELFIERYVRLIQYNEVTKYVSKSSNGFNLYAFSISLLKDLLSRHYINLRKILNFKSIKFVRPDAVKSISLDVQISRREFPIILIMELLIEILGSKKIFVEAINDLQNFTTSIQSQNYQILGSIIPLLDIKQNKLDLNKNYVFTDEPEKFIWTYSLKTNDNGSYYAEGIANILSMDNDSSITFSQPNVLRYFYKLIVQLEKNKIL